MRIKKILIPSLLIGLLLIYFLINPYEVDFLLSCPLYNTTHYYCPGCGSQRALHQLLNGNIQQAITNNLLFILGIAALFYHYGIQMINYRFKKNYLSIFDVKWVRIIGIVIILIYWILRNIPNYPFTLLAPIT